VQCVDLSDDELWQAIAVNTDTMSELLHQRAEVEAEINGTTDFAERAAMMSSYMSTVNRFEADYRAYTAEIRRRYSA
jgi:hypothetical protein